MVNQKSRRWTTIKQLILGEQNIIHPCVLFSQTFVTREGPKGVGSLEDVVHE